MNPELARNRHGRFGQRFPVSGVERKWDFGAVRSESDPEADLDQFKLFEGGVAYCEWKTSANVVPIYGRCNRADGGDFGTDPRCWCVRGKRTVSSTANLGRRQRQPANCSPTIYRKPFARRKAAGVTPIHFRNTRFSWVAPLNPTASATSAIDRSLSDNISFATLIRSDRTY
jgi:hypothetical protein